MTIECYFKECSHHSYQTEKDDGPFCYQESCLATKEQLIDFGVQRGKEIEEMYKEMKVYTP